MLIHTAIGKRLTCIFVDNGLLRKNEALQLKKNLKTNLKINIRFVSAQNRFLKELKGVRDPKKKRKIIGKIFMDVFEAEAKKNQKTPSFSPRERFILISSSQNPLLAARPLSSKAITMSAGFPKK